MTYFCPKLYLPTGFLGAVLRRILILLPLIFVSACFTATKEAFDDLTKGSISQCPIASKNFYKVIRNGGTYNGQVKFGAQKIGATGETVCFLNAGKEMQPELMTDIRGFVARSFYKINSQLFIAYNKPYSEKGSLYFIKSDKKGGWEIYGTCKLGSADCPTATSKKEILALADDLESQEPSYVLEAIK